MSEVTKSELDLLKERADVMHISYSPNIGVEALKKKVNAVLDGGSPGDEDGLPAPTPAIETPQAKRLRKNNEARLLRRVRITCMNPNKKAWEGEVFTAMNSVVGTIERYVPFDVEAGWHVEQMIYQMIKDRKFQTFYTVTLPNGQKGKRGKLVPEFAVEDMKPLTKKELEDLAQRQLASGSLAEE